MQNIHNILVGYDTPEKNATINIFKRNDSLKIIAKNSGNFQVMATMEQGTITKDSVQDFKLRALHNLAGLPFVVPQYPQKGNMETVSGPKNDKALDVIVLDVSTANGIERVELTGGQYVSDNAKSFSLDGLNFRMWYGAKILETPFNNKLNDFQLEKYPGSESAASYASEITVVHPEETFDYRIYMNHILDFKGYKFFQSSYDLSGPTEESHLSVNHDALGSFITYLGYSLLYIGMICILFAKNTRFDDLKKGLRKIRKKKASLTAIALLFFAGFGYAQHEDHNLNRITDAQVDSILQANMISLDHANEFSRLVIQDVGGRMKPAHTFASEVVRKVAQTEDFKGMNPSQVLLSIIENPRLWFEVPIIYLEDGNTKIREQLGLSLEAEHARLSDFITPRGEYKIKEQVAEAQKKKIQNKFEKDLIKIDRRIGDQARCHPYLTG